MSETYTPIPRFQILLYTWLRACVRDRASSHLLSWGILDQIYRNHADVTAFHYTTRPSHLGVSPEGGVRVTLYFRDQANTEITVGLLLEEDLYRQLLKESLNIYHDAKIMVSDEPVPFLDKVGIYTGNHPDHLLSDVCFTEDEIRLMKNYVIYRLLNPTIKENEKDE